MKRQIIMIISIFIVMFLYKEISYRQLSDTDIIGKYHMNYDKFIYNLDLTSKHQLILNVYYKKTKKQIYHNIGKWSLTSLNGILYIEVNISPVMGRMFGLGEVEMDILTHKIRIEGRLMGIFMGKDDASYFKKN